MITVSVNVNCSLEKTWDYFTSPDHMVHWNFASDDWHSSWAQNDLCVGGTFVIRMEAKDGSFGFDFEGVYKEVTMHKGYTYELEDGRRVIVTFYETDGITTVQEEFDPESENTLERQQYGWQCILDHFKQYCEAQ